MPGPGLGGVVYSHADLRLLFTPAVAVERVVGGGGGGEGGGRDLTGDATSLDLCVATSTMFWTAFSRGVICQIEATSSPRLQFSRSQTAVTKKTPMAKTPTKCFTIGATEKTSRQFHLFGLFGCRHCYSPWEYLPTEGKNYVGRGAGEGGVATGRDLKQPRRA